MASRGKGRGKSVSFDVQALGFARGEALPAASLQPPPLFPVQVFKPLPLPQDEEYEYKLALKQEFVGTFRKSQYYLKADKKQNDIVRYSDKYQLNQQDTNGTFTPDFRRLPAELKPRENKKRLQRAGLTPKPNILPKKAKLNIVDADIKEIEKTLETLEKTETEVAEIEETGGEKEGEKNDDDDETIVDDDEVYDEDDLEEETDYATNYFDNGEGYGDDDGDDDEGPVY